MDNKDFRISDDSGFMAIVNADKYNSFVSENWTFDEIKERFIDEMNNNNLVLWGTGFGNIWSVFLGDKPSSKKSFREFSKSICITKGELYLTNYEDLTMTAQFKEEKIPQKHNSNLVIKLDNGIYHVLVRQLFDPNNYDFDNAGQPNFEIVIEPFEGQKFNNFVENIFWWTS
jgi:hypothetical protein